MLSGVYAGIIFFCGVICDDWYVFGAEPKWRESFQIALLNFYAVSMSPSLLHF